MDTYSEKAYCSNCRCGAVLVDIPVGELKVNFNLGNVKCPDCGNYSLKFITSI